MKALARGIALTLALWFGGVAALALVIEPRAVIAFAPAGHSAVLLAQADARLVRLGDHSLVATSENPGLVRRLYAAGAWFVWPAIAPACGR